MKNSIRKLVLAMSIGILAAGSTLYAQPQNDGLDDTYDTSIAAQDAEVPDLPDVTADTIEAEILPSGVYADGVSYAAFDLTAYDGSFRNQLTAVEASFYEILRESRIRRLI